MKFNETAYLRFSNSSWTVLRLARRTSGNFWREIWNDDDAGPI